MKSTASIRYILWTALLLAAAPWARAGQDPFDCTQRDEVNRAVCIYQVFPQIAVGGGFSGQVILTNQGYDDDAQVRLDFFADDGQPLVVDLGEEQPASQLIFPLGAGETRRVPVSLENEVAFAGYARVTHSARASLRGSYLLRVEDPQGTLQTQLGVPSIIPLNNFNFPVEVDPETGINTGLAIANGSFELIANPDPAPQGFVVTLIDGTGVIVGQRVVQLDLNSHTSLFINDDRLFSGLTDFSGVVSVSGGIDFGLTALRLEEGILSTISVSEGPVFSAFDVTAELQAVAEQEPNDGAVQAQPLQLPARVQAEVSPVQDTDLFSIEGQEGQILTVYTVTPRGLSFLDSYLALETPEGQLLAFNDLNRLIRRVDSFLQVVLPADGSFLLRVEDFALGGGATFGYELVVLLEDPPQP